VADIAVSTLIQQIENHIRANRSAQALALCTHILHYSPKHLETYSLMAQALAQQGNLDGALDVYRRVLSADPENPAAYAGIAHVFDYRHRLEEAVWHMERAFELMPAQPDIRAEMLRLYAQYETEPRTHLKLTRGALARLYVQEGLYDQAIHEFREIGSTSLSRYDIRVALAETLWRAGRTRDAAQVAQSLLDSLPYCLKANLILGTAWHESAIAESQKYLERAVSLDPSNQVASRMLGSRSPLRIAALTVPDYVHGAPPPQAVETKKSPPIIQPSSAPVAEDETLSLFDAPEEKPRTEPPVEKIETRTETNAEPTSPPTQIAATETMATVETFPGTDTEKSDAVPVPGSTYSAQEIKPSAINVDLPPWLVSEAESTTESSGESAAAESSSSGGTPSPEWYAQLQRTFSQEPSEEQGIAAELIPVPGVIEKEPVVESPTPEKQEPVQAEPVVESQTETVGEDVPDWLGSAAPVGAEKKQEDKTPAPVTPIAESQVDSSEQVIPVWLKSPADAVVETGKETEIAPAAPVTESPVERTEETIPAWLTAKAEETKSDDEAVAWMKEPAPMPIEKTEATQPARAETQDANETIVPKWVQVLSQREPEITAEETPARLEPAALAPPVAEIQPAPARADLVAPAPQIAEPVESQARSDLAPPVAEYSEPKPALPAPSAAQPTQVAEPEPPIVIEAPVATPLETKPKRQPKYFSRLAQAREHRQADHIKDALSEYEFVIAKAPRLVPEVILDLEALVATGDVSLDAHRLLGDAYTRAGRLNDALERYRYVKRQTESNT